MKNKFLFFLLLFPFALFSQEANIKGIVVDIENNPISFVNILVSEKEGSQTISGAVTDDEGKFIITELENKDYFAVFSMVGYTSVSKTINPSSGNQKIILEESIEELDETVLEVKTPTIVREPGKLVFTVENTSLSTGDSFNLLKKTPGVLIIGDKIQVKNSEPIVYINDKRVYLTTSELSSLLKSMDASDIKSVEVITNPSSKYGAEASTVLNITTSKVISIGYKGSVNATWEQATFSKYRFSTSHFYKNDWLNIYGNYSFNPRKDLKEDENYIRFFNPDNTTTKSIWESDFEKITNSNAHQGNILVETILNEKNTLQFSSNILVSPDKTFDNKVIGDIYNAQREKDSVFNTTSYLENDAHNLSFNLEHEIEINEEGTRLTTSANYINYYNSVKQDLQTNYFLPSGTPTNTVAFFTDAEQDSEIITGQTDYESNALEGELKIGLKYSNIDTESSLDFYNTESGNPIFNDDNSDLFIYTESIYAAYINYAKSWEKFEIDLGLRGEYTDVKGDSKSLGVINNQEYFDLFPTVSLLYQKNEDHLFSASYRRSIQRPRYQSLNPFSYYVTDNIVNNGNPNLVPTIKNKYALSYNLKNAWTFEAYYIYMKDPLALLSFQDNQNSTTQNIDANIIRDINFSLDISYAASLNSWWYFWAYTSGYYLENEFYALASPQETYTNDTFGFYAQVYSNFTLSKDGTLTSDLNATYISNLISGSLDYNNQFICSVSFRKSLWSNRASISAGIDDIFNTNNVPVTSRYYNQDNSYFAMPESRMVRVGFKYNFGNYKLKNYNNQNTIDEENRLN